MLSSWAAIAAAILTAVMWHWRRSGKGWPRRRVDYVWAFISGGIVYVMVVIIVAHHAMHLSYAEIFSHGFGEHQLNIAFLGALFEAGWALWDLWERGDIEPGPEA